MTRTDAEPYATAATMDGDRRTPAIRMAELLVRSSLADLDGSEASHAKHARRTFDAPLGQTVVLG